MSKMSEFRLIIVEDNEQDLDSCRTTVARYIEEKTRKIELIECKSVEEAFNKLDNSFDGAIIDMKLADQGDEGNQVIKQIELLQLRIPVAILTGTPDPIDTDFAHVGVYKKGDPGAGYADLLDKFWEIHNTGLTRIMGGRGIIEETLGKVFRNNILPQVQKWSEYGNLDSRKTEKALLRHTLNHLTQLLDDDEDNNYPEEVYLYPPLTKQIRTGSIVRNKTDGKVSVVMNPACDLVIREGGNYKTDRVLLISIDSLKTLFPNHPPEGLSGKERKELENAFKNTKTPYYHWLPKTDFFDGGFLNFRNITTLLDQDFNAHFGKPEVQISPSFVKDMVARFSAYYARQGQPEIDFKHFIEKPQR
jgi:hypothetical protein